MADLTPDQAIEKLKALPEDKQRQVLTALSPDERKGILGKLTANSRPTPGQHFSGSPKGIAYTYRQPKEFMQQASQQLGEATIGAIRRNPPRARLWQDNSDTALLRQYLQSAKWEPSWLAA